MNRRACIKLLFCIFFAASINAQVTGVKFAPDGTRWSTEHRFCVSMTNCPHWWTNFQIKGDTVIGNKYCQKIDTSVSYYYDSACMKYSGRNLYYYSRKLYIDTFLIYDFNLVAGDTFNLYVNSWCGHNGYYKMPVDSVDSMYYGNTWRKRITFKKMSGFYFGPVRWVEGIGDIDYGFDIYLPPVYVGIYGGIEIDFCLSGFGRLNCFQEQGYAAYGNFCHNGSCATSVIEENNSSNIFVYPNPSSSILNLVLRQAQDENAEIRITDMLGNIVKQEYNKVEKISIDIGDLQNGIYFVCVKTSEGVLTKKIIVQH